MTSGTAEGPALNCVGTSVVAVLTNHLIRVRLLLENLWQILTFHRTFNSPKRKAGEYSIQCCALYKESMVHTTVTQMKVIDLGNEGVSLCISMHETPV